MRILMLCPLLSSSSFITTYPYAKILSKRYEITIVGPLFNKEVFIKDNSLNFEIIEPPIFNPIQLGMLLLRKKNLQRLLIGDYDVVHTFKLLPHTAPVVAEAKRKTRKPFVLTIDDYDVASPKNPIKKYFLKKAERAYKEADKITVSSQMLKKIYGGEVIYQVPNESLFKSFKSSNENLRKKLNLEGKIVLLYAGTFHEHKGIDILIQAVKELKDENIKLLLIGNGNSTKYKKIAGRETIFLNKIPIEQMPKYVFMSDIYVIPTKDTEYSRAEIPGKIFEPMIMGKPIIASKISDIPIILDKGRACILTKPNSVESLKQAISKLAVDPKLRKKIGQRAKKRYFKNYSYKHLEKKIFRLYASFE